MAYDSSTEPPLANRVLSGLPAAEYAKLRPHLRRVALRAGEVLFEAGDQADRVYFPESCMITLLVPMQSGRHVASTVRGREGAIGYVEAAGSNAMLCRAVVQIAGDASVMPASAYRHLRRECAFLPAHMDRRLELLLADARQSVACQASHSAFGRLARTLLECHRETGLTVLPLTHELLGDLTGLGRTIISQSSNLLKARKLIDYQRGSITLLDLAALEAASCECFGALSMAKDRLLN